MSEVNDMYRSDDYESLQNACREGKKEEIELCYQQLCMGYSASMLENEIGTLESLILRYCEK